MERVRDEQIERDALIERLLNDRERRGHAYEMSLLTHVVGLVAEDLPPIGITALAAARRCWIDQVGDPRQLVEDRVACWQFLDTKNGHSGTIADREDRAVRLVICLLFAEESSEDDAYLTVDFMIGLFLGLGITVSNIAETLDRS